MTSSLPQILASLARDADEAETAAASAASLESGRELLHILIRCRDGPEATRKVFATLSDNDIYAVATYAAVGLTRAIVSRINRKATP